MSYVQKAILAIAVIIYLAIMLCSCQGEKVNPQSNFTGAWSGVLCGYEYDLVIGQSDQGLILNGFIPVEVNGNSFEGEFSGVTHKGELNGDVLTYSQSLSGQTCSDEFTRE